MGVLKGLTADLLENSQEKVSLSHSIISRNASFVFPWAPVAEYVSWSKRDAVFLF